MDGANVGESFISLRECDLCSHRVIDILGTIVNGDRFLTHRNRWGGQESDEFVDLTSSRDVRPAISCTL